MKIICDRKKNNNRTSCLNFLSFSVYAILEFKHLCSLFTCYKLLKTSLSNEQARTLRCMQWRDILVSNTILCLREGFKNPNHGFWPWWGYPPLPPSRQAAGQKINGKKITAKGVTPPSRQAAWNFFAENGVFCSKGGNPRPITASDRPKS